MEERLAGASLGDRTHGPLTDAAAAAGNIKNNQWAAAAAAKAITTTTAAEVNSKQNDADRRHASGWEDATWSWVQWVGMRRSSQYRYKLQTETILEEYGERLYH